MVQDVESEIFEVVLDGWCVVCGCLVCDVMRSVVCDAWCDVWCDVWRVVCGVVVSWWRSVRSVVCGGVWFVVVCCGGLCVVFRAWCVGVVWGCVAFGEW